VRNVLRKTRETYHDTQIILMTNQLKLARDVVVSRKSDIPDLYIAP